MSDSGRFTVAELLQTANEDDFLEKLSQRNGNGAETTPGQEKTAVGAQGASAGPPGGATAAAPIGGGDTAHGAVTPGGPVNITDQQMGDHSGNAKVKLMDLAMRQAASELTGSVAATRGAGTDEGHNAGTQPRSGMQEYQSVASPQVQAFQDPHQPLEADNAGGMKAAEVAPTDDQIASDLITRLAQQATKIAAELTGETPAAGGAAPEPRDESGMTETEKTATARAHANECVAQGLYVNEGLKMGLAKAAADGELTQIFAVPVAQAHEAAFESLGDSPAIDGFAEKVASLIVSKVESKLGIPAGE